MSASAHYKPDSTFQFQESGQTLFIIRADGTIERGEGFTTIDEMSLKFWELVEQERRPLVPLTIDRARNDALEEAARVIDNGFFKSEIDQAAAIRALKKED